MAVLSVQDIMIKLEDCATVSTQATLADALFELEKVRDCYEKDSYLHHAVLVCDQNNKIVGRLSHHDLLKALEPKYPDMKNYRLLERFSISSEAIQEMINDLRLLENPLKDICGKAADVKVKHFMSEPLENEMIDASASIKQAIVQFLMAEFQYLLVTRNGNITGIIRVSDVVNQVADMVKACKC